MSPEIVEFLTGSVVNVLALKGLIGNKGVGATNVAKGVSGASKLRNPLLITAALAASLLIPSLAKAGQSGDKRRQELATKVISGDQTINKPDVSRFRNQLNRFDRILSSVSLDKKKSNQDTIDMEGLEKDEEKNKKEENKNKLLGVDIEKGGIAGAINRFFKKDSSEENITEEITNNVTNIEGETKLDLSSNIEGSTIEGDTIEGDTNTISLVNNISKNNLFNFTQIEEIISPVLNNELELPNLDISQMGKQIASSEVNNNVIDLSSNQEEQPVPSGFSGIAAKSASISVATRFNSGGGTIDKFEAASSLRSYGAYS